MDIKSLVRDIHKGKHLDRNLDLYKDAALANYTDLSALELVFSAFTLMEELKEEKPEYLDKEKTVLAKIKTGMKQLGAQAADYDSIIDSMESIRSEITKKMDLFTAYTDRFICYEYVLNRMEPKFMTAKEQKEMFQSYNENTMMQKLQAYMFQSKDQAAVNESIRSVVTQLPIHLTKSKFFERLAGTLTLYKGGDKSALNDFVYMLRTSGMIYEPEELYAEYGEFHVPLEHLADADYASLTKEQYEALAKDLEDGAKEIHEVTDFYYSLQKVVNGICAVALCQRNNPENTPLFYSAMEILQHIIEEKAEPEELVVLEGKIERFVEDAGYMEAILFDVKDTYPCQLLTDMAVVANLLSGSLFIDVNAIVKNEKADDAYVAEITEKVVKEFENQFDKVDKPVRRAIMAQIIGKMPLFFKTSDEVKEYIQTNLFGCQDKAEKLAAYAVLDQLMKED